MKKIIYILALVLCTTGCFELYNDMLTDVTSRELSSWFTFLGGSGYDRGKGIIQTADDGYIVCGVADDVNPAEWPDAPLNNPGGNLDILLSKYSYNGKLLWYTFMGGNGDEGSTSLPKSVSIEKAPDGGFLVATNSTSGDLWSSTPINEHTGSGSEAVLCKFSSSGKYQWHTFSTNAQSYNDIIIKKDGTIAVFGTNSTSNNEFAINSYKSDGTYIGTSILGSSNQDTACSAIITSDGEFILSGISYGSDWPASSTQIIPYKGSGDGIVVKCASDGTPEWHSFIGGSDTELCRDIIAIPNSKGYVITGYTDNGSDWESTVWGTPRNPCLSGRNVFVASIDINGNALWHTFFSVGYGRAIDRSKNGNYYIAGWGVPGTTNFPKEPLQPKNNSDDLFVICIDSQGRYLWHTFLGGDDLEHMDDMIVNKYDQCVMTTGSSDSAGWITNPIRDVYGNSNYDQVIIQLDIDGILR